MKMDADAACEASGKDEQMKRVFWSLGIAKISGLLYHR
jgi:hypothetical protein